MTMSLVHSVNICSTGHELSQNTHLIKEALIISDTMTITWRESVIQHLGGQQAEVGSPCLTAWWGEEERGKGERETTGRSSFVAMTG